MKTLSGVAACLVLFAGSLRAEAQEEKAVKAEAKPKGVFITTVGTHKLHDGRVTLKIEEKNAWRSPVGAPSW
jgi:hypothetical protein